MKAVRLSDRFLATVVLGMVVVVGLSYVKRGTGISELTQVLSDSLDATRPAFLDSVSAIAKRETIYVARASQRASAAEITAARAEVHRALADSLAQVSEWRSAYDARTHEADSLRRGFKFYREAFAAERDARTLADANLYLATQRLSAVERNAGQLRSDLTRASRRRLLDRVGVNVGYGATSAHGQVYTGPTLSASFRVWPP